MLNATKDKKLATAMVGSFPRPSWFTESLRGRPFKVALGDSLYREQYMDAVACYINEQERAGLDILTDGDARFDLEVGGRRWRATYRPTPHFWTGRPFSASWMTLAAGLLVTATLASVAAARERHLRFLQEFVAGHSSPELSAALRIRWHILIPVALVTVATTETLIKWFLWDENVEETTQARALGQQAQQAWSTLIDARRAFLRLALDDLTSREDLTAAFQRQDRAGLLARARPLLANLRDVYGVVEYTYLSQDQRAWLRVHDPNRLGDRVTRPIVQQAARTGQDAWGIEVGTRGTYVLSYARPWRVADTMIGYITLGVSLGNKAGLTGGIVHPFNHAMMKATLFLVMGAVYYRIGSVQVGDLAGLEIEDHRRVPGGRANLLHKPPDGRVMTGEPLLPLQGRVNGGRLVPLVHPLPNQIGEWGHLRHGGGFHFHHLELARQNFVVWKRDRGVEPAFGLGDRSDARRLLPADEPSLGQGPI